MSRILVLGLLLIAFLISALPLPQFSSTGVMVVFLILDMYYLLVKKAKVDINYLRWLSIFFLFCLISVIWSIDVKKSIIVLFARLLPVYSVMFFVSLYSRTYRDLEIVLKAFYISAILFLVYVISVLDLSMIGEGRLTKAVEDADIAESMNSNYIAGRTVLAFYIGYFIFWKLKSSNIYLKIFHIFISLILIYVVLVSGSRTSLGIMLLPLLVFFLKKDGNVFKKLLLVSVLFIGLFIVVMKVPQFYNIIGARLEDAFNVASGSTDGSEDVSRLALMVLGWEWFLQKPILGYGINCFKVLSSNTFLFAGNEFYAHNNYVELMVDVGIIGLIVYYLAHISLYRYYKRFHLENKGVGIVVMILLVVMLFTDIFWVGYYNNLSQFLLCITFTVIHIERNRYRMEAQRTLNDA